MTGLETVASRLKEFTYARGLLGAFVGETEALHDRARKLPICRHELISVARTFTPMPKERRQSAWELTKVLRFAVRLDREP